MAVLCAGVHPSLAEDSDSCTGVVAQACGAEHVTQLTAGRAFSALCPSSMANPFVRIIVQVVVSGVGIIAKGLMGAYARGAAGECGCGSTKACAVCC